MDSNLFCVILNNSYFILKFVMSAEGHEDIDYEEDVTKLKRVWDEIKQPNKKMAKTSDARQTATQTKILNESNAKQSREKKSKVIVSQQNLKKTVRNPKNKPDEVIQVVTRPQKMYSDKLKNERNNVAPQHIVLTNPEKINMSDVESLKKIVEQRDHQISLLRVSNSHNQDKVRRLQAIIEAKEDTIEQLRARERQLTNQLSSLNSKDFNFNYGKVQYQNYRHDSRRLLKLLKATSEYQKFAEFALDDGGVRFLTNLNKNVKTKLDAPSDQNHFHFCTCNKAFIPEPYLWVPQKAHDYGKQFIKSRNGELSQAQLQLLLYELNKIWRQREKRIVNHINAQKAHQIGKYKRKIQEDNFQKQRLNSNE